MRKRTSQNHKTLRLQKFLAVSGQCSRRAGEKLIATGRVSVNGEVVQTPGRQVDPRRDEVRVDGKLIRPEERRLFIFHKPVGVTTTLRDPHARQTLERFVRGLPVRVFPVGRLDSDVNGLLLLTNDGDFTEQLLHPRYMVPRVYWARVRGEMTKRTAEKLRNGVKLTDGLGKVLRVESIKPTRKFISLLGPLESDESALEIEVGEGRKHFVKRILAAVGHRVERLCRIRFGDFALGDLQPGELREVKNVSLISR